MPRRTTIAAAVVAVLTAAPVVATVTGTAGAPAASGAVSGCPPGGTSAARLVEGSTAKDPNSLSAAQVRAMERSFGDRLAQITADQRRLLDARATINVPIVWQVITNGGTGTSVSNDQIRRQLNVMNRAYKGETSGPGVPTPFRFTTKSIVRTNSAAAYAWDDTDDVVTKGRLRKGGANTLNVYVADSITLQGQTGILGYATFPSEYQGSPDSDGVVLLRESFPGGNAAPYDKGDTLTHEAGHWLGLYHTFQDGCSGSGDRVSDTPAQADGNNIFSCKESLDTCPAKAGRDPVHNYMSYGTDVCLSRFSDGQSERMRKQWYAFRD